MRTTDAVVIGGGQAGLAMSRCLSDAGVDHVVLERGRVAERWRSARWDSLRLLTPNWQSRLPGFRYDGPDPDGYMSAAEVVTYLERYAGSFTPPIEGETTVHEVSAAGSRDGYRVVTDQDEWRARAVVVATGYCDVPVVPAIGAALPRGILQLVPDDYRNPSRLPMGGVLVVGASATGIQLADEIHRSGRPVTVAAGHHLRVPRRYRGRDIMWWLDRSGMLDATEGDVYDIAVSRSQPSLQLVGRPDHSSIDLARLRGQGVRVTGRLAGADQGRLHFADDLVATTAASDVKLAQLLSRLDEFATRAGLDEESRADAADAFEPHWPQFVESVTSLGLHGAGINTVIWATGFSRAYPWLKVPVLDRRGEIVHAGGVTPADGLFVVGLQFLRRRNSNFIDGVGRDAQELTGALRSHLNHTARALVSP